MFGRHFRRRYAPWAAEDDEFEFEEREGERHGRFPHGPRRGWHGRPGERWGRPSFAEREDARFWGMPRGPGHFGRHFGP